MTKPDLRVTLRFLTTDEGGRKTLAYSGYRPQFYYNSLHYVVNLKFPKEGIAPGERTTAELEFLRPELLWGNISVGKLFGIYEGQKKVAEGEVVEIIALEEKAQRAKRS
jgi:translation elongation factor EF-Tu-like GTPase